MAQSINDTSRCCPDDRLQDTHTINRAQLPNFLPMCACGLQEGLVSGVGNWVADEVLYQVRCSVPATMMRHNCIWRPMQQQPDSQALAKAVHPLQLAPERTSPATASSRLHSCYWSCSACFAAALPV